MIYDLDQENLSIEQKLGAGLASCKRVATEAIQVANEGEEVFLQTRTVSLNEVRKSLPLWIPSLQTEIDNFDNNQAIQRITDSQARDILEEAEKKEERAELIPGMGVFTRKADDRRRRKLGVGLASCKRVAIEAIQAANEGEEVFL